MFKVLLDADRPEVLRVYAAHYMADMIQMFALWNRAYEQFIGDPVRLLAPLASDDLSVSPAVCSRGPEPARIRLVHLRPEAGF